MDYAGRMGINTGKAAIFDLDGTLLDSMGVWDQVDIDFLGRRGIEVPDDYMTKVSAMQFRQIAEYTIARFGLEDTPDVVEAKPHAVEYLHLLRTSGAKLAVATSLPPALRDPAMAHVGIGGLFDEVVSVDDAGDVSKESPDVYLLAAERLGVSPADCTVFEDLLVGIKAAKSVGMTVWAMNDDSSAGDWAEICEVSDGVLFDFSDAPEIL